MNHHRIDYIELHGSDLPATKAFYETVFGWKFTDYGPGYTSFEDGRLSGGFDSMTPPQSGGTLVVIYSEKLEESLAAVTAAGGTVTKQIFDFPGGRRFQFTDPSGNELAVWSE